MFHPFFVSLCFSIIYILFHSIPSSSLSVYHNEASCYDVHLTASSEFSSFNTIRLSFFLTSQRTRMSHTCKIFISLLILLSGDIQSNSGPVSRVSSLNMCILNIRSFTNPFHNTADANILSSCLITHPPSTFSDLVDCYNSTFSQLLNKHAPLKSKITRTTPCNPWYTLALKKLAERHFERIWSRTQTCALLLTIIKLPS